MRKILEYDWIITYSYECCIKFVYCCFWQKLSWNLSKKSLRASSRPGTVCLRHHLAVIGHRRITAMIVTVKGASNAQITWGTSPPLIPLHNFTTWGIWVKGNCGSSSTSGKWQFVGWQSFSRGVFSRIAMSSTLCFEVIFLKLKSLVFQYLKEAWFIKQFIKLVWIMEG